MQLLVTDVAVVAASGVDITDFVFVQLLMSLLVLWAFKANTRRCVRKSLSL